MGEYLFPNRLVQTMGNPPRPRMTGEERITKKRLNNPVLWRQLDAITNGTWVNHLGRGHARQSPQDEERAWIRKIELVEAGGCQACVYGNTAVFLHRSDCKEVS